MTEPCASEAAIEYVRAIARLSKPTLRGLSKVKDGSYPDPAVLWEDGIEAGIAHLFDCIQGNYFKARAEHGQSETEIRDQRDIKTIWKTGEAIASSICGSKTLRATLREPYEQELGFHKEERANAEVKELLEKLNVTSTEGEGRRLRMELLVAGWMVLYWRGYRNEVISAGVLRLATVQSAFPFGLCFWLLFGLALDNDRYSLGEGMAMGDIYAVRTRALLLEGDKGAQADIDLCWTLRRLAHLYGLLQAALALKSRTDNNLQGLFQYHLFISESKLLAYLGGDKGERRDRLAKRIHAWHTAGLDMGLFPDERIAAIGSGLFCNMHGIGYFGPDDEADTGSGLIHYRGYQIERESLMGRRREAAKLATHEDRRPLTSLDDLQKAAKPRTSTGGLTWDI